MIRNKQLHQLVRFGISGVAGFLTDAGIVTLCTQTVGMEPIPSQAIAVSVAVTVTWIINRRWTFADHASDRWAKELARYIAANSLSATINNGVYANLVLAVIFFRNNQTLAVAIGSISGMMFNFISSKTLVFNNNRNAHKHGY